MNCINMLCGLVLLIAISGCQNTGGGKVTGLAVNNAPLEMNSVRVLDKALINQKRSLLSGKNAYTKIAIEKEALQSTATGMAEVVVIIRNQTDYDLSLEGRTTWYDNHELPIGEPSAWQRLFVPFNSAVAYRESAVSPAAEHYQVDIREGR